MTGSSEVWSAVSGSRSPRDGGAAYEGPGHEGSAFDGGTAFGGPAFHGTAQGSGSAPDGFGDPAHSAYTGGAAYTEGAYTDGAYADSAFSDVPDHSIAQFPGQSSAGGYPDGAYPGDSTYPGGSTGGSGYGEPYAPYASGSDEYADPYSGQYAAEPHAQSAQYHPEGSAYENSAYPAAEYENTGYPNAASGYAEGAYAEPAREEYERSEYPEFDSFGSHAAQYRPEEARQEEQHAAQYTEQYAEAAAPGRGRRGRARTAAPGDPGFDGGFGTGFDAEFEAEFGRAGHGAGAGAGAVDDLDAPARFPGPRSPEPDFAPPPDRGDGAGYARSPEPVGFAGERDDADGEPAQPTRGRASRRPITSTKPRVSLAGKAVRGVVLAALIGGVVTYVALDKTVTLSVDGSVSQIHTFDSTVGSVLAAQSITTGSHDLVSPAPTAHVGDSTTITVRYGRPLTVTVNGTMQHVWVHATTVDAALEELGVRTTGAKSSMPMSAPISRSGAKFSVYTMRHITFLVDGKTEQLDTTAATVNAAMAQAGITLHNQDAPSVPANSVPTENETITIDRIQGSTEVQQVSIPYTVDKENDPNAYQGTVNVVTAGQNGVAEVTYEIETVNGVQQPPKQVSETVTQQPVTEVEQVGTEALPTDASSLDWAALANCESGGNPAAVDPSGTYYGLYQFSVGTWDSLGGTGLPSQASSAEQTDLAELLYERSGSGQWPVCGHFLFS